MQAICHEGCVTVQFVNQQWGMLSRRVKLSDNERLTNVLGVIRGIWTRYWALASRQYVGGSAISRR